ncbi:hypothetical protein TOPH_02925 [Tolypocladium ophioglossoides CBS 100239]|uniref:Uncharacterized protein n=1 Tax=Tolypocladium ophioglossoides (strain CBS 100239) TaxID=1163406 RepID=A0A0L0NEE9_TOLOC|nr:hypothetical protein TOPH_02925 [Tolypocladium ophioglossoides CBS 100239]
MAPNTSSPTAPVQPAQGLSPSKCAHAEADAARAMDHTNSWTPSLDRRQSWSKEDQKRALQMSAMDGVKTGPGFTEKRA